MAKIKRIDPAKAKETHEQFDLLLPHQIGHYNGAYPHPMTPLLATLMVELGEDITGKEEFRRRLEVFRTTGHPTIDELRRALGLTLEYVEGVFAGWYGETPIDTRPDFLTGLEDGRAARENVAT